MVSAGCRRNWTAALIPRSACIGIQCRVCRCGVNCLGTLEDTKQRGAQRGSKGRNRTGIASLPHVKLSPRSALGPTTERQEQDAIFSFAGGGQRRRLFRVLDILTIKWATGDLHT